MRQWSTRLVILLACSLSGCSYGKTHNPVSFPYLPLFGDIVRTHSKPAGEAYFKDYDRHAARMEVTVQSPTAAVGARQIVLVSILDAQGNPLRSRSVEWTLEGAGSIHEVDESGLKPGRGYKVDSKHAVTYTDWFSHTLKKFNGRPEEDVALKPGQTWCVISSMSEGDSHLSIWAPEIANWDENRRIVTIRWVDAEWTLPPVQSALRNSQPVLSTLVRRRTDRAPISGYRVRYRILDGAPAVFVATQGPEAVVSSDERGAANLAIAPAGGQGGRTRIGVEIIRPADPSSPSGSVVVIGQGETAIDWEAPALGLEQVAPATIGLNQDLTLSLLVVNKGNVPSGPVLVRTPLPQGVRYVGSEPRAVVEGDSLLWRLNSVPARGQQGLQVVLRGERVGPITTLASLQGSAGERDERTSTIQVLPPEAPRLSIEINGAREAALSVGAGGAVAGNPLPLEVVLRNTGTGVAEGYLLVAEFDALLEHELRRAKLETNMEPLAPGQTRTLPLPLRPRQVGVARIRVAAMKDGKAHAAAEFAITIREAGVGLKFFGPQTAFLGQPTTWEIEAFNKSNAPLSNVVLQYRLPPEIDAMQSSDNGQIVGREITWNLGPLQPGGQRRVKVMGMAQQPVEVAKLEARVLAQPGDAQLVSGAGQSIEAYGSNPIAIRGLPSLKLQVRDSVDPIEVGQPTTYRIDVTNDGTAPISNVQVSAALPDQVKFVGANGPTRHAQQDRSLTFEKIPQLQPGQSATYYVEVTALIPGDARLRVLLLGGSAREPLMREESTNIR